MFLALACIKLQNATKNKTLSENHSQIQYHITHKLINIKILSSSQPLLQLKTTSTYPSLLPEKILFASKLHVTLIARPGQQYSKSNNDIENTKTSKNLIQENQHAKALKQNNTRRFHLHMKSQETSYPILLHALISHIFYHLRVKGNINPDLYSRELLCRLSPLKSGRPITDLIKRQA